MYSLQSILLGTWDFLRKEVLEGALQSRVGTAIRSTSLRPPAFPRGIPFSDWWVIRTCGLKNAIPSPVKDMEVWRRAFHVPNEKGMITLPDSGPMLDVEYVIQEHIADTAKRHFDLRIVIGGKSVSWAIPMKGKREGITRMPVPGEKWAAIRQPDHAVVYNKFEGEIPKGEYGAGTVRIIAAGKADVLKVENDNVHFKIFDGPAKGEYVLVRTKGQQGLIVGKQTPPGSEWSRPRYVKKTESMLTKFEQEGYWAEKKVDGAAMEVPITKNGIRVFSHRISKRTGVLVEHSDRMPYLRDIYVPELEGTVLRAEAWHPNGASFLAGTLNSGIARSRLIQATEGPVRLAVFDIVEYKGQDVRALPYDQRRALYEQVCREIHNANLRPVSLAKQGFKEHYDDWVNATSTPSDGEVIKNPALAYDERPWIKVKPFDTVDCTVVAVTPGRDGKYFGSAGALTVQTPEGKHVQVGTGFSEWERNWIWEHRDSLVGEVARVHFHVRHGETTASGPRFDSWHPDQSEVGLQMYAELLNVNPHALKAGNRRSA